MWQIKISQLKFHLFCHTVWGQITSLISTSINTWMMNSLEMEELDTISQLTNLNSLRGKRTFRKEQIAKHHKLIKEYLERPIRDVTKEDIDTISRGLQLDLKFFNTLQSRIHVLTEDKIKSEEEQAAAELKFKEIKAKHRECRRHLLHLKTRHELYKICAISSNYFALLLVSG